MSLSRVLTTGWIALLLLVALLPTILAAPTRSTLIEHGVNITGTRLLPGESDVLPVNITLPPLLSQDSTLPTSPQDDFTPNHDENLPSEFQGQLTTRGFFDCRHKCAYLQPKGRKPFMGCVYRCLQCPNGLHHCGSWDHMVPRKSRPSHPAPTPPPPPPPPTCQALCSSKVGACAPYSNPPFDPYYCVAKCTEDPNVQAEGCKGADSVLGLKPIPKETCQDLCYRQAYGCNWGPTDLPSCIPACRHDPYTQAMGCKGSDSVDEPVDPDHPYHPPHKGEVHERQLVDPVAGLLLPFGRLASHLGHGPVAVDPVEQTNPSVAAKRYFPDGLNPDYHDPENAIGMSAIEVAPVSTAAAAKRSFPDGLHLDYHDPENAIGMPGAKDTAAALASASATSAPSALKT